MAFSFGYYPKVIIFPLTAFVEMVWDIFIESIIPSKDNPDSKEFQERLGMYFMLFLGEGCYYYCNYFCF